MHILVPWRRPEAILFGHDVLGQRSLDETSETRFSAGRDRFDDDLEARNPHVDSGPLHSTYQ